MDLANKTIVITGGTDGLGLAIAKALVAKGARVVVLGRDKERLDKALKSLGEITEGFTSDVSSYEDMERVSQEVGETSVLIIMLIEGCESRFG
jgi:NAD(P)-dependent dehydrogenase (short-subunit alcohol dehydrogenase family)